MTEAELRDWLIEQLAEVCFLDPEEIDVHRPMAEHGLSSRDAVSVAGELEQLLGAELPATLLWDHPTVAGLAAALTGAPSTGREAPAVPETVAGQADDAIAVIGVGCRFPGAANGPEAFWELLRSGTDAVSTVPRGRWADENAASTAGGYLTGIDEFDAEYFAISPAEARRMDPQQRMLLEVAREALGHAAVSPDVLRGTETGVYIGISGNEYAHRGLADPRSADAWCATGGSLAVAANRLSYAFDLRGPSMAVDTACSSSLVAVHNAIRGLRAGDCRHALAGGANLLLGPAVTASFDKLGVSSRSGRCRPFSADADGIVRAEGAGVLVLKRLADARADGDRVLAVLAGSAVNSDGRTNGLTAPNVEAQQAVLRAAYADAGIDPARVDFVEAHGTGTLLGDPIEARALGAVLGGGEREPVRIGSVKGNFGHLEAAAGIAGVIKTVLALEHGELPASLNYAAPNPHIDFTGLGLTVAAEPFPLRRAEPAVAGVSGFGFGGTNAHIVVRQAEPVPEGEKRTGPYRVLLGEADPGRLAEYAGDLADWLGSGDPGDLAHTCARRFSGPVRRAVVAEDAVGLTEGLRALAAGREPASSAALVEGRRARANGPVWVFSGQGSQWAGMGTELLATEPAFAAVIDELEPLVAAECGFSVRELITADQEPVSMARVQPVLFAMQLGLAALWRSYGQAPAAVLGHSMGEVAAAVVCGALELPDAVKVIAARSRILDSVTEFGTMASIALPQASVEELLGAEPEAGIAAINSRSSTVISGATEAVHRMVAKAESLGVSAKLVKVTAPAHSPVLDPFLGELRTGLAGITVAEPEVPCYHTVGTDPRAARSFDAEYWGHNLREPVRFAAAVEAAAADGFDVFVEISPHPVLAGATADVLADAGNRGATVLDSLRREEPVRLRFHTELAAAQLAGFGAATAEGRIVQLPLPPWRRRSHWVREPEAGGGHRLLGTHVRMPDGKTHVWQRERLPEAEQLPWLGTHLGAAEYVEMARAAAAPLFGDRPVAIEELRLLRALPLGDQARVCTLAERSGNSAVLTITSRVGGAPARTHARLVLRPAGTDPSTVEGSERPLELEERASGWLCAPDVLSEVLGAATEVASVRLYGDPAAAVQLRGDGTDSVLLDEADSVLCELRGVRRGEQDLPLALADKLYRLEWEQQPLEDASATGTVAVLDGAPELHEALRQAGYTVAETVDPLPDTVILCAPRGMEVTGGHVWYDRLYELVRTLVTAGAAHTRLVLLTTRAAAVRDGDPVDPVAAAVRASVRLLAYEHPELRASWLDIEDTGDYATVAAELAADTGEDEVAWRSGNRYVARLTRAELEVEPERASVVRPDGAYVVTGGLGGIGLVLAGWLADAGAARIVLNGRSEPKPEARQVIEELAAKGTEILVETGDIAEEGVAERLVSAAVEGSVPLRGILHGAAVIDDRVALRADAELLARVWLPKVAGAWRLHLASRAHDLDFWAGFSSMMGVLSFPGHAAYSPANACLDAIVAHRRALGLPGTTVNWGVWAKAGAVRDGSVLGDIGTTDPVENIEALEAALAADVTAIGVNRPLEEHLDKLPDYVAERPFLERLAGQRTGEGDWPGVAALRSLEPQRARELLAARLLDRVADILGVAGEALDTRAPLPSIGVDSLVAVRIRNSVQHDTGALLPPSLLLRGASIEQVRDWIGAAVFGEAADTPGEVPLLVPPRDAAERLLETVGTEVLGTEIGMTQRWTEVADEAAMEEIAERLTRRSDHVVTVAALREAETVERAAGLVREPETPDQPVRVLRAGTGSGQPLFLFHPGGGDTLVYRQLVDQLDPDLAVYGFDRLDGISDITDRVAVYLPLLREIQPHGPYRLAGWSFGGALAYAVAARLAAEGERVELVAMIDTLLPLPLPEGLDEVGMLELRFARFRDVLRANYGMEIDIPHEWIARLGEDEQVDAIIEHIESHGFINAEVAPAIIRHQRTSYEDVQALQRFRPQHLSAPVVLYSATDRQEDGIRDPIFDRHDLPKGWDEVLGEELEIVPTPGHHLSVLDPPNVNKVAEHLRELLAGEPSGKTAVERKPSGIGR
ncbi:type I polyketide synthase [Sciscionella marina]|uniref:type I polyketide synthase n=1 Tax=Sciscionella marina TaxID=508770 RepID=UPI0003734C28|nr:type I polyketide synthase [Sciscionella marina]